METTLKPQKRDKSLVPFSKDHHYGLLFTWKLRQGLANGTPIEVLSRYVRYFWETILKNHCKEEEIVLRRLVKDNHPMRIRMEEEHHLLHAIIDKVLAGQRLTPELLNVLQQDLVDHIRWEERELFPYIQQVADPDELQLIGKLLEQKWQKPVEAFEPEFWVVQKETA
ncbi:hemerythrin domain-containing protein [Pontibacter ruber]|uniref:Hemerythrin domain-containing protein n=1 Tax=Pontibacter ruber TaxID=1343895 RepID=A0ABW5CV00_9BACT|nr:hemerythrin domain-containing protein [Pontibacter ruber]